MRLRIGMIVALIGGPHLVELVNDCSARVRPLTRRRKTIVNRITGVVAEFDAPLDAFRICSDLPDDRFIGWMSP